MRIEIEVSDDEARELRSEWHGLLGGPLEAVLRRVEDALPQLIHVGDKVVWGHCPYEVLAVWGTWAWVGDDEAGPYSVAISSLSVVDSAIKADR